ncbi:TnsD family Tn7-like transposition protein [Paraburkholderia bannensis]|uniref:TnsD family Tn7-like transposition protein n=1 Tax=Paraburkholderia bannensis TaxID=765414 RepID=UPI002AC32902|nr:TnsD family Tn7-like transposition protein [Paraburkholderia bannensis]
MALALRLPFQGELLSTILIEYLAEEQVVGRYAFLRSILNCQPSSLVSMPRGLKRLSEETRDYWQMTATDIAIRLTCMPYHIASSSPETAASALAIVENGPSQMQNARELVFGCNPDTMYLRFCRQCISERRKQGRRPYFQREHQLPGVAACAEHGQVLTISTLRASMLHVANKKELLDVFSGGQDACVKYTRDRELQVLWEMARRSKDALHATPASYFCIKERYRQQLAERGFLCEDGSLRLDEFSRAVVDYFGQPYLSWLKLCGSKRETQDWIGALLFRSHVTPPTIAHILLQQFLATDTRHECKDAESYGSWQPGSYWSVDWERRDALFLAALKDAANKIRAEEPARRLTSKSIQLTSKLPGWMHHHFKKLPRCRGFLEEAVESAEQFRARRAISM